MIIVYRLVYNHFFDVHSKLYNIYIYRLLFIREYIRILWNTYIHT